MRISLLLLQLWPTALFVSDTAMALLLPLQDESARCKAELRAYAKHHATVASAAEAATAEATAETCKLRKEVAALRRSENKAREESEVKGLEVGGLLVSGIFRPCFLHMLVLFQSIASHPDDRGVGPVHPCLKVQRDAEPSKVLAV